MNVPLHKVYMAPGAHAELKGVMESGYIGEGPQVHQFELAIADFIKRPHVAAVSSCTMGLQIALRIAQISDAIYFGKDSGADEVITQPITCSATNMAILSLGLKPVWADTDPSTCQMDPGSVADVAGDKTLAVIATHWGGAPADVDRIRRNIDPEIPVIGDAAHAFGAQLDPREISVFSFQAIKHVTCGDGGGIALPEEWMLKDAKLLRWFGLNRALGTEMRCMQDPPYWGFKGHMNDIAASIGRSNMLYLRSRLDASMRNAIMYWDLLDGVPGVRPVPVDPRAAYWVYTIMAENRDGLKAKLAEIGIHATPVHRRNDEMTVFSDSRRELPGTDKAASEMLCLPVGWWVSEDDVRRACGIIKGGW